MERHHILFNKRAWNSYKEGTSLRETPSLIVPLEHDVHKELHREVPIVPLLGYYSLLSVRNSFEPARDPLESVERFQRSIEQAKRHPKAHDIEKSLADLAVYALDLQKPYIIDSPAISKYGQLAA